MSESLGSDLDGGDNLDFPDFQEDRSRDSDGDLLVEAEEDAWTAEPSTAQDLITRHSKSCTENRWLF